MTEELEARFWAKATWDIHQPERCWEWRAGRNLYGYGIFRIADASWCLAHRVAYELEVAEIPRGLQLDHLCRNRACVNPSHLEPVTCGENIRRGDTGKLGREKTHCPHGHEYTVANTYEGPTGGRRCRECNRNRSRRNYERRLR